MNDTICYKCEMLNQKTNLCVVFYPEGQRLRQRLGYCPITEVYADWRDDKPKVKKQKVRIGQQKQRG